jgi:superfamily II DNA or RNA helicase
LKDYQSDVYFESQKYVELANSRLLIQLPTGAGKTRTAMEIVCSFLNKKENRQVMWLADRSELCEQAIEAFMNVWPHIGKYNLKIYRLWGENTVIPKKIDGASFIVGMYQKIHRPLKDGKFVLKADLIVTDEAHNVLAPTYENTIENLSDFQIKQTRIVGLTATPGRKSEDSIQNTQLVSFFNDSIIKIGLDKKGPIEYLQGKKVLARCIHEPLKTDIQYTLTSDEWKKLAKSFENEYPEELIIKIANDQRRNLIIIKKLLVLSSERSHVLVFGASRKQSKILCGVMISLGYSAVYVDGDSPSNYRKDVVKKFKEGDIQFIFNFGVFTAGFDAPNIDAVVITRPTRSIVLYGQMIGRGMRGLEIGGTEEFLLVDVIDNIITEHGGLDNVYEYFSEYWEN